MSKDQETKIVPPMPVVQPETKATRPNYVPWLIVLIAVYFALVLLISFLPLTGYMKVMSLFLGAFLVFDIHHSIKHYVKNRE